jgi:hypothetical protein
MAIIHGKVANIYWDVVDNVGSNINLTQGQRWTLDVTHGVADTTAMQGTWRTFLGGFNDWTATVECLEAATGPEIVLGGDDGMGDDQCGLELYAVYATADYDGFKGSAICTGVSSTTNMDGITTITYTFQGATQIQWFTGAARPGVV